jgi:hypothetical protein
MRGTRLSATIDLRAKLGAWLYIGIGKGIGATGLTNGINVEVRRTLNNDGICMPGSPYFSAQSDTLAASGIKACTVSLAAASDTIPIGTLAAAFAVDDDVCFWGDSIAPSLHAAGDSLTTIEFARCASIGGTNSSLIVLDRPCKQAKVSGENVSNKANMWSVWCEGGATYSVVLDYSDDAAGDNCAVVVYSQTLDSVTTT